MRPDRSGSRTRAALSGLAVLALACASSCGGTEAPEGGAGGRAAREPHRGSGPRRIILFSMDTVRADRISGYADVDTTPRLAEIAAGGALFERFYAASTYTIPSHMSIMTGLDPAEHGVLVEGARLSPEVPTLAELLSDAGYRTQAFTEGVYVGARWGFDRGFDEYRELPRMSVVGDKLGRILGWVRNHRSEPYFLFVHTYAAHFPYGGYRRYRSSAPERGLPSDEELAALYERSKRDGFDSLSKEEQELCLLFNHFVPRHEDMFPVDDNRLPPDFPDSGHFEQDRAALLSSYDARLRMIDRAIGELRDTLVELGQWEDTLLIVLSDHGEGFFEHGLARHDYVPFDEVLKVPLIVSYPGLIGEGAGMRPTDLAWHLDIVPTVLALAGVDAPDPYAGTDLSAVLRGGSTPERSLHPVVARAPNRKPPRPLKRIVIEGPSKYIEGHPSFGDDAGLLFDLAADPREARNRRPAEGTRADELAERSARWVAGLRRREPVHQKTGRPLSQSVGDEVELSAEELEELRAFGYLGGEDDE